MTPYPTYEDMMSESKALAEANSQLVKFEEIGKSEKGRPIGLLTITDSTIEKKNKTVFLLMGGTDGSEEVGRAAVIGFAKEILKPQYREHLKKQIILIVPVTNPDGTVENLPDSQGNGNGICASQIHLPDQPPRTQEGIVLRELVNKWLPDACVDFHGLAGGGMGESMYLYPTVNNKWSIPILYEAAKEISEAGAMAGFTQDGRPRLWWEPRYNIPGWLAKNHSSFCMVFEGTENYYPIEDSVRSGVVRLLKFIELGERIHHFQIHPNYPCDLISGGYMAAILSYGNNYDERRISRRDISQMIYQGVSNFGRNTCDHNWVGIIEFPVAENVKSIPNGMTFKATFDHRVEIKKVAWQDHVLESNLWKIERLASGQVVTAFVPEKPKYGVNQLSVHYDSPFKRHVTYPNKVK